MEEGANDVPVDVQGADGNGILSAFLDEVILHHDANAHGTALPQVKDLGIEDGREPVKG